MSDGRDLTCSILLRLIDDDTSLREKFPLHPTVYDKLNEYQRIDIMMLYLNNNLPTHIDIHNDGNLEQISSINYDKLIEVGESLCHCGYWGWYKQCGHKDRYQMKSKYFLILCLVTSFQLSNGRVMYKELDKTLDVSLTESFHIKDLVNHTFSQIFTIYEDNYEELVLNRRKILIDLGILPTVLIGIVLSYIYQK